MKAIYATAISCYYDTTDCSDDLWQCQTCDEWYCDVHWHHTDLGHCVECAACEYKRLRRAKDD